MVLSYRAWSNLKRACQIVPLYPVQNGIGGEKLHTSTNCKLHAGKFSTWIK